MKKKIMSIILIVIMLGVNVQYVFAEDTIMDQGKSWLKTGEEYNEKKQTSNMFFPSIFSFFTMHEAGEEQMQTNKFSELAGMLLGIGIFVDLIFGVILGVRLMFTKPEEKAKTKQALVIYLIGSIIIFGALGIWRVLVNLLDGTFLY